MAGLALNFTVFLHLLSSVVWIGGIIFTLLIAIPASKEVLGSDAGKLMGGVSKRFTPFANYSILLLVITGAVLSFLHKGSYMSAPFYLKTAMAATMISIHFYRGLLLAPKIAKSEPVNKASLHKLSLSLVKLNLALGVAVLFLAKMV
ncbi:MAG: hypothetical protein HZB84_04075 [Deltaproteobacteria bacterium]|nr:hypothetical protein [Deltaproteobacteria bacterium]